MGRADYLDLGNWNAACSMCGFKFKASELSRNWQGQYRCWRCQEPRQPQDYVRAIPDVQTPPWVQPQIEQSNGTAYLDVEDSATSLDLSVLYNATFPTGVQGASTVIINILGQEYGATTNQGGLIINALTTGTGWPAAITSLVINVGAGGYVTLYANNSGLPVTLHVFKGAYLFEGAYLVNPPYTHILAAVPLPGGGFGFSATSLGLGSITPTTLSGVTILDFQSFAFNDLLVQISGIRLQSFFTSVTVGGVLFLSSAATSFFTSPNTIWGWSVPGTQPITEAGFYGVFFV